MCEIANISKINTYKIDLFKKYIIVQSIHSSLSLKSKIGT